jgi:hypothetical protein
MRDVSTRRATAVACWIGMLFCASLARAQEPAPPAPDELQELRALSLEELMMLPLATGSFLQLDLFQSPLALTIIQREQIKASGARTLSELLEIYLATHERSVLRRAVHGGRAHVRARHRRDPVKV